MLGKIIYFILISLLTFSCSSTEFFPTEVSLQKKPSFFTYNTPSMERGEYLVNGPAKCGACHSPREPLTKSKYDKRTKVIKGKELSGRLLIDNFFMNVEAQNLTGSGRISNWSDKEIMKSIREGIRPDDTVMGIPMPFSLYRNLSDSDTKSIVLYLRSLKGVNSQYNKNSSYTIMRLLLPSDYGSSVVSVPDIKKENKIKYGEYLAGPVAHCVGCHSSMRAPPMEMNYSEGLGKGGVVFEGKYGKVIAPNITSHSDALGRYNDFELKRIIKDGITPNGNRLNSEIMPLYNRMDDGDLDALIAYLRTIPPLVPEEE